MSDDIYDDPDLQVGGSFVNWKEEGIGTKVSGRVVAARRGKDFNGDPCPELIIDTGAAGERTITAGQYDLKRQIMSQKPIPGQFFSAEYVSDKPSKPGQSPMREFACVTQTTPFAAPAGPAAQPASDYV